jgi:hypothetical protein
MAYTKNTWADGDIVTSEKLNHIEDGIANSESVFFAGEVGLDEEGYLEGTLGKTWQEIHDAMMQNKVCIVITSNNNIGAISQYIITSVFIYESVYRVNIEYANKSFHFSASTASGYPSTSGAN